VSERFVGVDGGGTTARAVVVDSEGRELGRAEGPGAVATVEDCGRVVDLVADVVRDAARAGGVELPLTGLWAGLAGAGREATRVAVEVALAGCDLAARVGVGTDVEAAFHDAFGAGPGMILIAGTGSIAWGRSPTGQTARVGGWGHLLGDEGSGYAIGLAGLRAVIHARDGRTEGTALEEVLPERLGCSTDEDLVAWAAGADKRSVAAMAPDVFAAADSGDAASVGIVRTAVDELERHVRALHARLAPWDAPPEVALWGGLAWSEGPLRGALAEALTGSGFTVCGRRLDPPRGAAALARSL
jgi:N-acetylglucosamine kinase-like BadF-type ATPase